VWIKQEEPDPFLYTQYEDDPVQFFTNIDDLVQHIDSLTQRALEEEAADEEAARAASAISGRPVSFEQLKARMRPGDFLIEGAPPDNDADSTFAAFGAEVRYAIKQYRNVPLSLKDYSPAGECFGFEDYHVAVISYAVDGIKHGVRLCRKPGEAACVVGSAHYDSIKDAVAAIAAEAQKLAE
jgi:hypothetical protein